VTRLHGNVSTFCVYIFKAWNETEINRQITIFQNDLRVKRLISCVFSYAPKTPTIRQTNISILRNSNPVTFPTHKVAINDSYNAFKTYPAARLAIGRLCLSKCVGWTSSPGHHAHKDVRRAINSFHVFLALDFSCFTSFQGHSMRQRASPVENKF
jgi:hypothetical protein